MIARFARMIFASFVCFIHFCFVCSSVADKFQWPSAGEIGSQQCWLRSRSTRPLVQSMKWLKWSNLKTHMSHGTAEQSALSFGLTCSGEKKITVKINFLCTSRKKCLIFKVVCQSFASIKNQFVHRNNADDILCQIRRMDMINCCEEDLEKMLNHVMECKWLNATVVWCSFVYSIFDAYVKNATEEVRWLALNRDFPVWNFIARNVRTRKWYEVNASEALVTGDDFTNIAN